MDFTTSSVQEELHDSNRPLCLLALTISYSNRAHHIISFNLNLTEISYNYKDPTTLNTRLEECPHYNSIEQINKLKQNQSSFRKGHTFHREPELLDAIHFVQNLGRHAKD